MGGDGRENQSVLDMAMVLCMPSVVLYENAVAAFFVHLYT